MLARGEQPSLGQSKAAALGKSGGFSVIDYPAGHSLSHVTAHCQMQLLSSPRSSGQSLGVFPRSWPLCCSLPMQQNLQASPGLLQETSAV